MGAKRGIVKGVIDWIILGLETVQETKHRGGWLEVAAL